ncbi:MAG: 16S rRNA (uracil(1498)-N(3))-methyltransferase [Gammaproteobacteria bacterium]|nr:MAG: 16S rRNA (uracil(1498)-N(3))-methyltransferase [Gammaproteobacteria bacterium]
MNLLLLSPDEVTGGDILLPPGDRRARHLTQVIQPQAGESLRVGVINGRMGTAQACPEPDGGWRLTPPELVNDPPRGLPLTLVMAMPRPKAFRRILQGLTALGVKSLYLINTYRVEKSYWQTPWLSEASLRENCLLGLEQARDTRLPDIQIRKRFKPFVEDELPGLIRERGAAFVAHPHPPEHASTPPASGQGMVLAVGPEGGFIPYEVDKLLEAGCEPLSLGPRILRVETALPTLIGKLYY